MRWIPPAIDRPAAWAARALALAALAALAVPLAAQPWYMYDAVGTWKPWKMQLSSGARAAAKATPAELKAFEGELLKFSEIWKRAPGVAEPRGFSVEVWGHLSGAAAVPAGAPRAARPPIAGGVTFAAFPIFEYERDGTRVRADTGETELLTFMVNDISGAVIGRPGPEPWRGVEHDIIFPFVQKGERGGFPFHEEIVVMTKRTAPLYLPVNLEEAWTMQVKVSKKEVAEAAEVVGRFQQNLDKHLDPAERASRQAEYQRNSRDMPDPAAYLRQMSEVEAVTEKSLRSELAPGSSSVVRLRTTEKELAAAEAALAALAPEQRAAEACFVTDATRVEGRLRPGPANARCQALVRPNTGFFDPSLPRSAPQIAILWDATRCFERKAEREKWDRNQTVRRVAGCEANKALIATWDRDAILAWLW
ncbi:hypothetical protein TBR22_A14110 [Luteitalea sp. TBR-22]|uniref:hypothetical protein n=1 Tax=Luteitalea sp. TBR-22 TaxID=2802971 RepID=UPI001AFBDD68|nr:hypothetical protein [Luteitalea sp. TBR-22]BCS32201.1 hypothetical protein TBR22_A14110 [Luteitalea sp. TBR-22]